MNVVGWEAEFVEKARGGSEVPNRAPTGIGFWEFEVERRRMVGNPAGIKNGTGMIDNFSAEEASLCCEGFELIAEFRFVGPGDKAVVDHQGEWGGRGRCREAKDESRAHRVRCASIGAGT